MNIVIVKVTNHETKGNLFSFALAFPYNIHSYQSAISLGADMLRRENIR